MKQELTPHQITAAASIWSTLLGKTITAEQVTSCLTILDLVKTIPAPAKTPAKAAKPAAAVAAPLIIHKYTPVRAPRVTIGTEVLKILTAAGPKGVSIKTIAKKLGKDPSHIYVWNSNIGKKIPGMSMVRKGILGYTPPP